MKEFFKGVRFLKLAQILGAISIPFLISNTNFVNPEKLRAYTVEERIYYELPPDVNIEEFSKIDVLKFREKSFSSRVSQSLTDGKYFEEKTFDSSENLLPEWMAPTNKIQYDNLGFKVFKGSHNGKSNEIKEYTYTEEGYLTYVKKTQDFNELELSQEFLTAQNAMNALKDLGVDLVNKGDYIEAYYYNYEYKFYPEGYFSIIQPLKKTQIDYYPSEMTTVQNFHGSEEKTQIITVFTINDEGFLVIDLETVTRNKTLYNGTCVKRVERRKYSDYELRGFKVQERSIHLEEKDANLSIAPNPSVNELNINGLHPEVEVSITIQDLKGIVQIQESSQGSTSRQLSLLSLKPGAYIVTIKQKERVWQKKIIKL